MKWETVKLLNVDYQMQSNHNFLFERSNGRKFVTTQYYVENHVFEIE